ncbi:hypothetical protein L1887_15033 [Cichorium endivia]|nr:hypothetical protein L1887_15033 [Cichorium endivia]
MGRQLRLTNVQGGLMLVMLQISITKKKIKKVKLTPLLNYYGACMATENQASQQAGDDDDDERDFDEDNWMVNLFGINLEPDDGFSTKTSIFSTNQIFKSREELMEWAKNTARSIGYVIITKRTKTYVNGFVYKVILMCDRGGEDKSKDTSRSSGSKKNNCKFELEGKYSKKYDQWTLRVICDEHNHPPAEYLEGHPFARRLSDDEARLVEDLTRKNVAPRDILAILKERNENNVSTIKTIYNAQHKIRMAEQAGRTPMQVLMSLLHANNYVYEFTTGDSNELENLFFVHPKSWDIWRAFPHVLIIDATYKTNKYNKPFVQIVGVTSTQKTFSIGFVFMHREKEANYAWALNCLKSILDDCMQPRVIITDRELALINACGQVFPNATRLLCRWHIEQNILKNCRPSIRSQHDWDSFKSKWKLLVNSPTWVAYMENYKGLHSVLAKYPGVLKYIEQTW